MKSGNPIKHFAVAFILALALYAIAFNVIEHLRVRKGPWKVTFTRAPTLAPTLQIEQATLGLTNIEIKFIGAPNPTDRESRTYVFNQPRVVPYDVPFGQCLFMDTTFLPGTVTFRLYGHEIELLPRVLIIDHEEHRWAANEVISLPAKPATNSASMTVPTNRP
jgi:hypothetical protein